MNEITILTPKQESFCVHYTTIGAETFSNGTKSAIAAGYSEISAYSQASALLKNPKIRARIKELHAENMSRNMITVDKVLCDLEHIKLVAREAGQFTVAVRCSELQGRYLAMFTDRHLGDTEQVHEFTERERIEAKKLARLLVKQESLPMLDVEVNGQDGQNSGQQTPSTPQTGGA